MIYQEEKKRIMWLCNSPSVSACKAFDKPVPSREGWLQAMASRMESDENIELTYLFPDPHIANVIERSNGNSSYIAIPENCSIEILTGLVHKYDPDIIHIWGTEYIKTYNLTEAAIMEGKRDSVVISIQGLVGACYYHFMAGIPGETQIIPSPRDVVRFDSLRKQKKSFYLRGKFEKKALMNVKHVIGRTFWDYSYVKLINPNVEYHFNNETLRPSFYNSKWSSQKCIRHRIFVSQASYPLKGFHFVLEAVSILKPKYPDISVVVSGADNSFKPYILDTAYGRFLRNQIKKYRLKSAVKYVGMLTEEEMLQQYLRAEVFVSPSSIENSPNSVGEAMLIGMPVIASNVGGVSDLLAHNEEGFLYQYDAPYLLAFYIDSFFSDMELEERLGKAASIHAEKTHNEDTNYSQLMNIYKAIMYSIIS